IFRELPIRVSSTDYYSLAIFGFGRGEEISTWVTLLLGSREASSSTFSTGSVWVLRERILVILPLMLRLFPPRLRFFSFTTVADSQLFASCSGVSNEVPV